jgi:sec-independent protein translocase protein TatB
MSVSEILLTVLVALIVFGPNKGPMLVRDMTRVVRKLMAFKCQLSQTMTDVLSEVALQENIERANQVEALYSSEYPNLSAAKMAIVDCHFGHKEGVSELSEVSHKARYDRSVRET